VAVASRDDTRVGKTRMRSSINPAAAVGGAAVAAYCLPHGLDDLERRGPPPWAPGQREEIADVEQAAGTGDIWCMAEVDIFADLSTQEMQALAAVAPMRTYAAGELLFTPHQPTETLFILKEGRVRVFRVSADGRALTTALLTPGTVFGEMVLLGQRMHDNFAEAIDEVVVCVMSRADVHRYLLSDARIAARISEILGRRVAELERRLSDTVFKTAPERIAATLCQLASQQARRPFGRGSQIALTHEQIAALTGTSRETATKILDDYADRGLVRLGRGKLTILDAAAIAAETGDSPARATRADRFSRDRGLH
jgi:CRP/FNR family transcriptional regulator, cyclic AMP receptor protein